MVSYQGRLRRSLLLGCSVFIVVLCALSSLQSTLMFRKSIYNRYNSFLSHVIYYVDLKIDREDTIHCLETGETGEKYSELQSFLNEYVDAFNLTYLYIIKFNEEKTALVNICSATSQAERDAGEEDMPFLMVTYAYDQETIDKYVAAWSANEVSYFEESSDFGFYYTACRPVVTDSGEVIGLICADLDINELHKNAAFYITLNILLTALIAVSFVVLLMIWLERNVTGPIMDLERSARRFADKDRTVKDPRMLYFVSPAIKVKNEIKSLAEAIEKMTEDMKDYVEDILTAEERERNAQQKVEGISAIAYYDALTHVKNKASFSSKADELNKEIEEGSAEFAIVMIDLNLLKHVNDTYGHVNGDKYLIGAAGIICDVYKHSPVFRVGGDEFVVVVQGQDYQNRAELICEAERRFRASGTDTSLVPWERYSAAVGMSDYQGGGDTVELVYNRADETMYQNKMKMKKEMGII